MDACERLAHGAGLTRERPVCGRINGDELDRFSFTIADDGCYDLLLRTSSQDVVFRFLDPDGTQNFLNIAPNENASVPRKASGAGTVRLTVETKGEAASYAILVR